MHIISSSKLFLLPRKECQPEDHDSKYGLLKKVTLGPLQTFAVLEDVLARADISGKALAAVNRVRNIHKLINEKNRNFFKIKKIIQACVLVWVHTPCVSLWHMHREYKIECQIPWS